MGLYVVDLKQSRQRQVTHIESVFQQVDERCKPDNGLI